MNSINDYLLENSIHLNVFNKKDYDNPPAERAVLFSTPGGLLRTTQRENEDIVNFTRKIEGSSIIYHYLDNLEGDIKKGIAPLLVDCLNCEAGCNGDIGTKKDKSIDELEYHIEERKKRCKAYIKVK